jgi:hypothetical protein
MKCTQLFINYNILYIMHSAWKQYGPLSCTEMRTILSIMCAFRLDFIFLQVIMCPMCHFMMDIKQHLCIAPNDIKVICCS